MRTQLLPKVGDVPGDRGEVDQNVKSWRRPAAPATKTRQQEWRWSLTGGLATALVFAVSVTNFGELPTIASWALLCTVHLLATVTTLW